MNDGDRPCTDECRRTLEEQALRIAALESRLAKADVAVQIVTQTNGLLDRELFRSTIVAKVGEIAADILDYDRMTDRLLELVGRVVDYDVAGLLLLQASPSPLGLRASQRAESNFVDSFVASMLAAAAGETGRALDEGECRRTILTCHLNPRGERACDRSSSQQVMSFRSSILRVGDDVLGMLAIGSGTPDAFRGGEIDSFELIAAQAAIVVDDAARHEALAVSRRRIEELHETARILEGCESQETVHATVLDAVRGMFESVECCVDVAKAGEFHLSAASCELPDGLGRELPLTDAGVEREALAAKMAVPFDSSGQVSESRRFCRFRSGLALPIGDTAVLLVLSSVSRIDDEDSSRLLELLSGHAAEALERISLRDRLKEQAIRDPLTGAFNRRHYEEFILTESARARRSGTPIGFLMGDIDDFKEINDTYGHDVGDRVLVDVVRILRGSVRETDSVVRSGGDEFLVVLPDLEGDAAVVRARVESAVAAWNDSGELDFRVGLSVGSTKWDPAGPLNIEETLKLADERMYDEKRLRKVGRTSG
ncbi:MAG: sensor domain-containing diguanylate cyclase [Candidatus Eisenbacteria bacterium]